MSEINNNQSIISGKVSVCVPSYNHSRFIKDNLEAIFAQNYRPMELIVIDDGSSDNSPQIIKEVLLNCPFDNKFIIRPNKGLPATINEGLELSNGEFFAVIASDDVWFPDFIRYRVTQLQKRPDAVLAYGNSYLIDDENKIIGCTGDWAKYDDGDAKNMLLTRFPPSSPSVVYRRSALDIQKWNSTVNLEDFDLYLRLCNLGDFAFDPTTLSAWRQHSSNMSKRTTFMMEGFIQAINLNAESLQLDKQEVALIGERYKWECVDSFLNSGQRVEALKTAVQTSRIKVPFISKLRQFTKIFIPKAVLEFGQRRINRNSSQWHGIDIKGLILKQKRNIEN